MLKEGREKQGTEKIPVLFKNLSIDRVKLKIKFALIKNKNKITIFFFFGGGGNGTYLKAKSSFADPE